MKLYIDPGTGSMLFTILLGVLGAGIYALRNVAMKARFWLSGGKDVKAQEVEAPYAIFSDSKRYWNVFGPICREFDRRGQEVLYMTASPDDPALKEPFDHVKCEFIGEGNRAFAKLNMLRADVLLSTTPGLEVYQWKRSKDVKHYCHILHMVSDATLYRMFGLDFYDSVLLSGPYQIDQIRALEAQRDIVPKEMTVVGQPYMDGLWERLQKAEPLPEQERTVLLAPSWGPSSILNRYGEKFIDELVQTGYHVIIRPHPQSFTSEKELLAKLQKAYPDGEQVEWNSDNDNFEVLRRSDILISDFSGVVFDFALVFNKPVIYADTSFDKGPYDAWFLDDPLWTFETLKRIGSQLTEENFHNVKQLIDTCLSSPAFAEARDRARAEAWNHIGESAKLTVDFLMKKYDEIHSESSESAA